MDWPHGPSGCGATQAGSNLSHQTTRSLGSSSLLGVGYSCRNFGTRVLADFYDWFAHSRVVRRASCGRTHKYCKSTAGKCAILVQELGCEWFAWWRWRSHHVPADHGHLFSVFGILEEMGYMARAALVVDYCMALI